jgi:hypothetical protein
MLVAPLAAIAMVITGAGVALGEPAPTKFRTQPRAVTPPARFDLAKPARIVREVRPDRLQPLSNSSFEVPLAEPSIRYSIVGVAMGLGDAAVDNDRFDMRALRLEQGRGGRMRGPLDAGLRLRVTGSGRSMQADVGLTGGVAGVIGSALQD